MKKTSSKQSHCYVDKNDDNGEDPSCVNCNRDDEMTLEGDTGSMIDVQNPLENETDNTNLVDEYIHVMNTQDPLVAPNIVTETNNNQHPPPLIPYILTINIMTVKDLRDELSRIGLKRK